MKFYISKLKWSLFNNICVCCVFSGLLENHIASLPLGVREMT